MKYVEGDLISMAKDGEFDVIIHGCNTMQVMGAGIAFFIKKNFLDAYKIDKSTPCHKRVPGMWTVAKCGELYVYNAYTQRYPGGVNDTETKEDRLDFIKDAFTDLSREIPVGARIGIPKIGAGIAGGDWYKISAIIDEAMKDHDVTCVILPS